FWGLARENLRLSYSLLIYQRRESVDSLINEAFFWMFLVDNMLGKNRNKLLLGLYVRHDKIGVEKIMRVGNQSQNIILMSTTKVKIRNILPAKSYTGGLNP